MNKYLLAIETGGTKIQLVLGTEEGKILYRYRTKVDPSKGGSGILEQLLNEIPVLQEKAIELGGIIERIGIGFGGPVETSSGTALWSAQIDGWKNFPLANYLKNSTGINTYIFNDSNAAAWGEYKKGVGAGAKVFFYTNIGSGIGGGLVVDGKLFDGQGRGAAEFGQSYFYDPNSSERLPVNHIERVCSGWSIQERLRKETPSESLLMQLVQHERSNITCETWGRAIEQNDEYSLKVLDEVAEYFSLCLCNAICFYSPDVIAIGGGVSLIGDPLINRIKKYTDQYVYINNKNMYEIRKCKLDEDVVLVGTLLLTASM